MVGSLCWERGCSALWQRGIGIGQGGRGKSETSKSMFRCQAEAWWGDNVEQGAARHCSVERQERGTGDNQRPRHAIRGGVLMGSRCWERGCLALRCGSTVPEWQERGTGDTQRLGRAIRSGVLMGSRCWERGCSALRSGKAGEQGGIQLRDCAGSQGQGLGEVTVLREGRCGVDRGGGREQAKELNRRAQKGRD